MTDIQTICTGLKLAEDGIWYSQDTQNVSYPLDGNESCFAIEGNSFWFKHRNNCVELIVRSYPPENKGPIFDIGGGNGFVSSGLVKAGFGTVLVEPGRIGAQNAKERGIKNVICATISTAKFKQHSVPAVGLFDVIEHIEDDLSFLQTILGIMKPGGYLYITTPAYSFLWSEVDKLAGHFRRYSLKGLSRVLQEAGFQVVFPTYFFRFLPIPIFFFRVLPYKLGLLTLKGERKMKRITRDHAVKGGKLLSIFNPLLRSEIKCLENQRVMSFGGSCLIVARSF